MIGDPAATSGESEIRYSAFERDEEARLAAGQVVASGSYRVREEIGRGGMAVVYEAEDLRSGELVALKVVTEKFSDKADTAERYRNEARLAAALSRHPNVVTPRQLGRLPEFHQRLFLVTDLVRGRSLGAVVLEHPRGMDVVRASVVARDLARAMLALHERGIVHRDIKPGNVLLESQGTREVAKLHDFGCAYALGTDEVSASADLTAAHERVGSPIYMAPEQAIGLRPTPAFDVYAFGATLYELLTGAAPYAGSTKAEVVQRKCAPDDPPRPVARARDDLPPRLAALVDACLAREGVDRPSSAAVVAELEAITAGLGVSADSVEDVAAVSMSEPAVLGEPAADPDRRAGPWLWVVAAVVVLGGIVAFVLLGDTEGAAADGMVRSTPPGPSAPIAVGALDVGDGVAAVVVGSSTGDAGEVEVAGTEPGSSSSGVLEPAAAGSTGDTEPAEPADSSPSPAPRAKASVPRWATPECEAVRDQAVQDRVQRRWNAVLEAVTAQRKCWRGRDERLLLHVAALVGLGRHEDCARLASGSKDRQVQRMAKQCEHKLGEPTP
ncbi:MAG: protein kinase [Nannocystaceae bacterium]